MIQYQCEQCRRVLSVPEDRAGSTNRCPGCGALAFVPNYSARTAAGGLGRAGTDGNLIDSVVCCECGIRIPLTPPRPVGARLACPLCGIPLTVKSGLPEQGAAKPASAAGSRVFVVVGILAVALVLALALTDGPRSATGPVEPPGPVAVDTEAPTPLNPVSRPLIDARQVIGHTLPEVQRYLGPSLEIDYETGAPTDVIATAIVDGRLTVDIDIYGGPYAAEGSFIDALEHGTVGDMLRLVCLDQAGLAPVANTYMSSDVTKAVYQGSFAGVGIRTIEVGGADPATCNWVKFGPPE